MSGDAGDFNNMETRPVIKIFFSARQSAEGNSRHSDRNVRGTSAIVCHRQKLGGNGKVTKGVLSLHNNAPSHQALKTQKKLAYLGFQYLDHPPYSPDLAPSDYRLFPGLKKTIESSRFFVRRGGHCCCGDLVGRTTF